MKIRPKQAKLNPEAVRYIRRNPHGKTRRQLAEQFGVATVTVNRAAWYWTWRQV